MPAIGATIGYEGRRKLNAAASHPSKKHTRTVREILESLGRVVVLHFDDGTKAERLNTAHWPSEDWRIIAKAVRAGEYIRTSDGVVHFTA